MNTETKTFTCTCANRLLLAPGEQCDICMGIVPEQQGQPEARACHGPAYFEDRERFLMETGLAA